jgi:LPXTG-motif cell wall-anchored protein
MGKEAALKSRFVAALAVTLLILALGVGPAYAQEAVSMEDNFFSPATVTVTVGGTVTWTNNGDLPHTTTGPTWDSGIMSPGDTFTATFNTVGTFDYVCEIHVAEGMVGTVIVQAGDGNGDGDLPETGPGSRSLPFLMFGLILVLGGGALLLALRRRRA